MKLFVGVTDNEWFRFLKQLRPDEINFWVPSPSTAFRVLAEGEPFLFKLHSPENFIVGGGFFVTYSILPLSLAWQSFAQKNGVPDYASFFQAIGRYRQLAARPEIDPRIGCIILASPFFFDEDGWIPAPSDWAPSIVRGKTYDIADPVGAALWKAVEERLYNRQNARLVAAQEELVKVAESPARYGVPYLVEPRLGQGAFRVLVTDAYHRRCAITGERTLPVLQAAHIKPFHQSGPNETRNGILLRADFHILFDSGYLTITDDYDVEVSKRIIEDWENGREYYSMHGRKLLIVPPREIDRPGAEFIEWHNTHVFRS